MVEAEEVSEGLGVDVCMGSGPLLQTSEIAMDGRTEFWFLAEKQYGECWAA